MKKMIKEKILAMKFDDIIFSEECKCVIVDAIFEIGIYEQNIIAYHYLVNAIMQEENEQHLYDLHRSASMVLYNGLNFVNGAYKLALHHDMKALELQPENIELIASILQCYSELPEKVLEADVRAELATKLLALDKNNAVAIKYM